jgi:hypothetical protein
MPMLQTLRAHWPEYLMEAWGLGTFMISAGVLVTLIEYPGSPVRQAIADPDIRRALIGLAMDSPRSPSSIRRGTSARGRISTLRSP